MIARVLGPRLYEAARFLIWLVSNTLWRIKIEGKENMPASGAFLLSPVHRSNIDGLITAIWTKRHLKYLAKQEMFLGPFGWCWRAMGATSVDRGAPDRAALKACLEVLNAGQGLVLFPEGSRRSGPLVETLQEGAVYLALKTGAPVVPVGIANSDRAMPPGKFFRPARVKVVIGEPMHFEASDTGRASRAAINEGSERLRARLQELYDDAQKPA